MDEIINDVTGVTVSCFEPSLDYVAVKVPRFEVEKFPLGYKVLGTQMKSVGESLALGRTFNEALNKALRAAEFGYEGISEFHGVSDDALEQMLVTAHPLRLFAAYTIVKREGRSAIKDLSRKTGFDPWFLHNLADLALLELRLSNESLETRLLMEAKRNGLSDRRIASLSSRPIREIDSLRESLHLHPSYHFVDTCSGEFRAATPYYYSTYGEMDEGDSSGEDAVIILGSGPNRIGQGLEFDTCCTLASLALRKLGRKTIMINSNPETVSTDFNISDKLYIEPLTFEHVKEIMRKERAKSVIVQLGGQTPLNMAEDLHAWGADIIGMQLSGINTAEDRGLFSNLVSKLNLRQPQNRSAKTGEEVLSYADEIGFPVLLRPSFVLGGKHMFIAFSPEELREFLAKPIEISAKRPVLVDEFLEDAFEYDADALCDGHNVYIAGIMQHIEAAGIHSGDSACVFPAFKAKPEILQEMVDITVRIAREISVKGFINIQFAEKDGILYILEVNPRASRTVPFLYKASGVNLVEAAVKLWTGTDLEEQGLTKDGIGIGSCKTVWAVKEAVFSFDRFGNIDPMLGPEMKSTGEVIGTGESFGEAYAKAQAASGTALPTKGRVFISVHDNDKKTILPVAKELQSLGFTLTATRGTAQFLYENGIFAEVILKIHEGHPNIIDHMRTRRIDLVINTPLGRFSQKGDHDLRIETIKRKIPYTTTTSAAIAAVEGIKYLKKKEILVRPVSL